ncbi:hypothetical protein ASPWEDRAFT_50808 [Aspergillus wentii DTO 134E9]|uniref:Chitin-binding type-4 domain-containing protein n=1 Tax=Aspergillus wentii DTO 134E9 TaxID=1073089 RepID=A0A1L9RS80_ASPWE|nr:uncharacterized protein ASPWEDRAFT_50808 [Aspergillus wentii DTO 134E9]OJJ37718.1 hypothetical protein ASPWEDRAFT_50808 [Aspergillus wentii DTO 134E9]
MKGVFIACGLLASSVSAHMQMSKPYPLRSPLNKDADGQKDYSYTNPLSTDGSDYPCKGYADDDFNATAHYELGGEYDLELSGSAVHGGGSCQIGLSYDKGETIRVIHSMLGGCPIDKKYKFKIPENAKEGNALLSWTWFNKVGNREMYMNCAQVTIGGGSNKGSANSLSRRDSFESLPEIFIANIGGPGKCTTIEGEEVNFPKPGPSVEGELSGKGYECKENAPFLEASSSGSNSTPASSHVIQSSSKPSPSSLLHAKQSSAATPSSTPLKAFATPSSKVASSFGTPALASTLPTGLSDGERSAHKHPHRPHWGCRDGSIICAPDGLSWAMCDHGHPVWMGSVADGMICKHGEMVRAHAW